MKLFRHAQTTAIYLMQFSIFVGMILSLINYNWMLAFLSGLILLLTLSPLLFEKRYRVDIPLFFELLIVLFIYASLFLGEVHAYYTLFWWWDVVLHIGSGVILGFGGFLLIYVLYYQGAVTARPFMIALFSFSFAVATGAVWEIFEYFVDQTFGTNMQETGLPDTMWDLIVDSLGALFVSILGYLYLKKKRVPLFSSIIEEFKRNNPHVVAKPRKIGRRRR